MAKEEEPSRRKHRRSGDGGDDSESDWKRRKHHSRSSRHHHHRHRSKHRPDEQEDGGDRNLDPPAEVACVDDEMEEGEIFEEEDGGAWVNQKMKVDSDVESGEIKPEEVMEEASSMKDAIEGLHLYKEKNFSATQEIQVSKEKVLYVPIPKRLLIDLPAADLHDMSREADSASEGGYVDVRSLDENIQLGIQEIKKADLEQDKIFNYFDGISANGSSVDTDKAAPCSPQKTLSRELEPDCLMSGQEDSYPGKYDKEKRREILKNLPSDYSNSDLNYESCRSALHGNDSRRAVLAVELVGHEKGVDSGIGTLSPSPRDSSSSRKQKSRDCYESKSEHSVDSGSKESKTKGLRSKKRSLSPESLTDKYGRRVGSPSNHVLAHGKDQSIFYDHKGERASLLMDKHEKESMQASEIKLSKEKDQVKRSQCREDKANSMGFVKFVTHKKLENKEDYHDSRNYHVDVDKEHNHSRGTSRDRSRNSVHGKREEKHDPWDRGLEKDGDKESNRRGSRDRGRENDRERTRDRERNRHDSRGRDREGDKDRERNRHDSWDRQRDRDKGRSRHGSRERFKEEDLDKERDREKERYSSQHRDGKRETDRDGDRDWEKDRHMVKDRERDEDALSKKYRRDSQEDRHARRDKYIDYRNSKYDNLERGKYSSRMKELTKDPGGENIEQGKETTTREEEEEENFQERMALQLAEQEEEDIERIKEESRKRRQAILEKHKKNEPKQDEKESNVIEKSGDNSFHAEDDAGPVCEGSSGDRHDLSGLYVAGPTFAVGKFTLQNGALNLERPSGESGLGEGSPKSEKSEDMFCDDIFGESPAGLRKLGRGDGLQLDKSGLHDNWDDPEGYYSYRIGEVLDSRYEIVAAHGKGVFSTVVRAKDLKSGKGDPEEIAIKIIRNNETMYKAGIEEVNILNKLVGADPEDRRHCVRFLSSFKYRNHLCLVFESLHMNLREVLKKFGRNIGLKLTAVRAYAKQLFIALKHLKNCGVLHCDIKPDNMLVNETKNVLKLCDFGNAMFAGKNEITPYLVSRFYRAPEIILGLPYDHALDIWSVGCCLYELYTGKVLFPGPSNNDMLRLHMELKGPFPKKMLRKGAFTDHHFDQDLNFHASEEDPVTKKTVKRLLVNIKMKDFSSLISSYPGEDPKMLANFKDLLDRIFVLDPEKRMTVSQALSHPFITGK